MKPSHGGFTLIEMLIAMTIFALMVTMTFANYLYYQNIAGVRLSLKVVSQSISEARNLALNGYQINNTNQDIGVIFDMNNPHVISFVAFAYNDPVKEPKLDHIIKTRELERGVQFSSLQGNEKILILFDAITGESHVYSFLSGAKTPMHETSFQVDIAFKTATLYPLKRTLEYYARTNMIDY